MLKKLSDIEVYRLAENLSNTVWNIVKKWEYFERNTIGNQIVRSSDSISANIAESHGRYHFKDKKKFGYYARGSLEETKSWIRKAFKRGLISKEKTVGLEISLNEVGRKLNSFINTFKDPR